MLVVASRAWRIARRAGALRAWLWGAAGCTLAGGCVPEGPPTGTDPPLASKQAEPLAPGGDPALAAPFSDDFERAELGGDWRALSPAWRIDRGRLCAAGARNRGVWLKRRLPENARIAFDASSASPEGDIKAEAWGDGRSGATKASYTDATSYLTILGGWKNTLHVLARVDEHGDDRQTLRTAPNAVDARARPVVPGQSYRFVIERRDGETVSWSVDGVLLFELRDPDPLTGPGHDHFGLNDWTSPVCFDNVKITPLQP